MLKTFSPGRVGGLRFLTSYLLSGDDKNEQYLQWVEHGTEKDKAEAEAEFDAWYERTYEGGDYDKGAEAHEVIIRFAATCEQSAFEQGAQFGAQLVLELLGVKIAGEVVAHE